MKKLTSRFALYNFGGKPTAWFGVEAVDLTTPTTAVKREPSHHIIVVDRSGSMYGDIPELRTMVEKLLTLSEFNTPDLRVSLISTSSTGDLTTHFKRVKVGEIDVRAIRNLQATGSTCLSQALSLAETFVDDKDVTCISFHTDGYANDRSPQDEKRVLQEIVGKLKKHPKVFVNTIAYRSYCDFNLLNAIANQLSGVCIQATGIKQVYDSLHASTTLLAGKVAPALEIPLGDGAHLLFGSRSARKFLGSTASMLVQGLSEVDDRVAFRLYPMTESAFDKSKLPISDRSVPAMFAKTLLADGQFNKAKYALVSTRVKALIDDHARALTGPEIAAFSFDLERFLCEVPAEFTLTAKYGLDRKGPSVMQVLAELSRFPGAVSVDMDRLMKDYQRRGVKMLDGVRGLDGRVTPPLFDTKVRDTSPWVEVRGFEFNNTEATINMLVSRPVDLIERATKTVIPSVAGVKLDSLQSYRNYTIVGDGALNIDELWIKINDKRLHGTLARMDLAPAAFIHTDPICLKLSKMPVIKFDSDVEGEGEMSRDMVTTLVQLTILSKILHGIKKATVGKDRFSDEQIAELKKHHITPGTMYFSPPSCVPYVDLKAAIDLGHIDTRLAYQITVGTKDILQLADLWSGNEYLQRRFECEGVDKPTLDLLLDPSKKWSVKKISARTKLTSIDEIAYPIYTGILGIENNTIVDRLLDGLTNPLKSAFWSALRSSSADMALEDRIEVFDKVRENVDIFIEAIYSERIRPLVFYIGATGLLPDGLSATPLTADQLVVKYPNLSPGKKEREGTFFALADDVVLGVYVQQKHFSTEAAIRAAR